MFDLFFSWGRPQQKFGKSHEFWGLGCLLMTYSLEFPEDFLSKAYSPPPDWVDRILPDKIYLNKFFFRYFISEIFLLYNGLQMLKEKFDFIWLPCLRVLPKPEYGSDENTWILSDLDPQPYYNRRIITLKEK